MDPSARFVALLEERADDLPLDEAVLLIAAHALPDVDVEAEQGRLDAVAGEVTEPTLDALRSHLVDHLGFTGDRVGYHDAENSLLPAVLDRRCGIPLSLAVVAMEVGRRCGVPLVGIGMPGHFLVRHMDEPTRFVDFFDRGAEVDPAGCRRIFEELHAGVGWDDRYLDPVSNRTIVARMLANLANAYRRSGDARSLRWALALRLRLPGASERERRELALLLSAAGGYAEAATLLEHTGQERDHEAAARLRARLN